MSQRPSGSRREGGKRSQLEVVREGSGAAGTSKQQLLSHHHHQRGSKASLGSTAHDAHSHQEKEDSEDDLGLGGTNWAKEIAPYVDAKYA